MGSECREHAGTMMFYIAAAVEPLVKESGQNEEWWLDITFQTAAVTRSLPCSSGSHRTPGPRPRVEAVKLMSPSREDLVSKSLITLQYFTSFLLGKGEAMLRLGRSDMFEQEGGSAPAVPSASAPTASCCIIRIRRRRPHTPRQGNLLMVSVPHTTPRPRLVQ